MTGKFITKICTAALSILMLACAGLCGCAGGAKAPSGGTQDPPAGGGNSGDGSTEEIKETEILSFDNTNNPLSSRIGVTDWGCLYMPDLEAGESSLLKGAEYVLGTGSRVIKVACGNLQAQYPLDDWSGETFEHSADIFAHETYRKLFSMGFETYFISVPERKSIKYIDGVSAEEQAYVEDEFYRMTKYLLETYQGSGKTFILQNWETDNAVSYYMTGNEADDVFVLRSYADYFNARQNGINRARDEFVMSEQKNVYVFGAIEINKLDESYSFLRAVDNIVPYTYCDLYLYSSYEYKDRGKVSSAQDVCDQLSEAMLYYKSKLPSRSYYPQKMYFGENRLAISEFGYPDKADGYSGEWQKMVVEGHLMAMQELNLQYAVYWQICCNEATGSNAAAIKEMNPEQLRDYVMQPGDVNGFYLIRPDGVKTYTFNYLKKVMESDTLEVEANKPESWQ